MIICIKRASPADQAGHLSSPVHLCRNIYRTVDADFLQLLCRCLCNINSILFSGHDADHKADFFSISLVETIIVHGTSRILKNLFCLFRIIIIMFHILIIVDISLQWTIGRHSLTQKHCINNCLPVNTITYCRNNIFIFRPVIVAEIKHNTTIIRSRHIIAGIIFCILKTLCIFRI